MGLPRTVAKRLLAWCALPLGVLATTAAIAQAQQGSITGRITATGSGEPLQESRVVLVGTSLFATAAQDGRYAIRNVPAGSYTVRVLRVGYEEQKKPVQVAAGEAVTLDFSMTPVVVKLTEVVTTATGDQRRSELGNAIGSIDVARVVETSPVSNVQDVLASRTPGVQVTGGSQVGGGSRVRIRGNNSLSQANDPIYIIDGIRMTSNTGSSSLFTGGAQPNRANDINPDEIENIEIVKGPSAATLYGTDAANGVIVITTKKGRAGAARWNGWAEGGLLQDNSDYPWNYTIAGHTSTSTYRECSMPVIAAGIATPSASSCIPDSLRQYSPFHDPSATPIGQGHRSKFGANVQGGSESLRYFVSGEREDEMGVLKLPSFEKDRLNSAGTPIPDNLSHPNDQYKYSFRSNLNTSVSPKLDLGFTGNLIHVNTRYATESNATAGIGSQIFGGAGYPDNGTVSGLGTPLHGYRAWTPGYTFQELNEQRLNRFITSGNANWRPFSWMQNRANVGLDYTSRVDLNLNRNGQGPPVNSTYRKGFKEDIRTGLRNFSFDLGSTETFNPTPTLNSRTTFGAQFVNYQLDQNDAFGGQITPGTQTPNSGASQSATEASTLTKTFGVFVEQQVGFRDRLFITGAVRSDQNSAFGTKFQRVFYPKASISWLASDESFFPKPTWLDQFRVRAAWGAAGVQPGPNDALRFFSGVTASLKQADVAGATFTALGNPELKPERTTEFEGGFDMDFLNRRLHSEITYYSKLTKDALIDAIVAPSAGAANTVKENVGSVKNAGAELAINTQIIDRKNFGFDVTLSGSMNDNKLVSLGPVPPQINTTWRAVAGYPLFGFWAQPITGWEDKNGDGILVHSDDPTKNEVFVGADPIFRGYSSPRYLSSLQPGIDLFGHRFRIASLFDYKGGYKWYNNTERIRCVSRQNCNGLMNAEVVNGKIVPRASFEEQAMVVATRDDPSKTLDGFFQPASFVRWREFTATWNLPESWAGRYLRSRSASLNFAARNLHLWTKYRGIDPEIDRLAGESGAAANAPGEEFQTLGIPTYYTLRFNLGF
ncbi:MAG TPA: SusC/RagA family TonB-linked outer membrane protein [Gemmatimonadaceae bacterium]|nr:SusC/RagA family TonB-linked outer membrane protein [Gemmatimonadaceae bacterium]